MASRPSASCTHQLRPGTTVCLHCRHDALVAARVRRQRLAVRVGIGVTSLGILAIGALLAWPLVRDRARATPAAGDGSAEAGRELAAAPAPVVPASALADARTALPPAPAPMESSGAVSATGTPNVAATPASPTVFTPPAPPQPVAPQPAAAPLPRPVLAQGVTALRDGMSAERVGDTVTVSFDTPLARTRRADKFEGIVRATLPRVYGAVADSALASMPAGSIAGAGDLLGDLSARGVRLRTPGGTTLLVTPATRPGRDGPLVVRYRAVAQR